MGAEVWPTVNIDIEATFSRVPERNFTTRVITWQRVPVDRPTRDDSVFKSTSIAGLKDTKQFICIVSVIKGNEEK